PRFLPETRGIDILQALLQVDDPAQEQVLRNRLTELTGTKAAHLMPSARAGLYWLLRTLRPTRLYLPAFLCSSIYECALRAGTPMTYLDCKPGSFETCLDGVRYESGSVLLLVHQYGIPANPVEARQIAQRHGLVLVEDAAPSLGAAWDGQPAGSFGDAAIVSFEYSKTISACKGGAVVYKDTVLAERVKQTIEKERKNLPAGAEAAWRRDAFKGLVYDLALMPLIYGSFALPLFRARHGGFVDRSQTVELDGPNPADFGARRAWLAAHMLNRLPSIIMGRRQVAEIYREVLTGENIMLAPIPNSAEPVYTHFPLLLPKGRRDAVVNGLWANGIDPGFNFSYLCGGAVAAEAAPIAYGYTERVLTLPVSSRLDVARARRIAETLRSLVKKA
ncbi:MAG: DegT/DnrJ/EryC1/StrS family aminotransferase, partial [Polynucleobacter sp.]|nr:DegT/DnrJ/EryC1/StrS family aminotransferase [Polynucleobacter sp.]